MEGRDREYYRFVLVNALRGLLWLAGILALYLLLKSTLDETLKTWILALSEQPVWVFTVFFISEAVLGIIPAEFFMIWATHHPLSVFLGLLALLALLSFLAGIVAYKAGVWATRIPFLKKTMQRESFLIYSQLYRKYGGVVIIIAALTPLPFGAVSMVSASLGFPFVSYLIYASSRFLRFAGLGWLLWQVGG